MRFHVPTRIIFGPGKTAELKDVVESNFDTSRAVLVTDRGIVEAGIAERVLSQLPGIQVFDRVEQNPKHGTVNEAGDLFVF